MRLLHSRLTVGVLVVASVAPIAATAPNDAPPLVIVWADGRWEYLDALEEKGDSYVYTQPGKSQRAAMQHSVDKHATAEVNSALQESWTACTGGSTSLCWVFELGGRSRLLFGTVASQRFPACYQRLQYECNEAKNAAIAAAKNSSLSDVAGKISIEKPAESPDVVISNESAGAAVGSVTQGGQLLGEGYDHFADYTLRADGVIKEECLDRWAGDSDMYRHCLKSEHGALDNLKTRNESLMPADVFRGIRDGCQNNWPRDYGMRDHCETGQIRSYWAIERKMDDSDFSPAMIQGLRAICASDWPDDFSMQEHCLKEKMEKARPSP